MNATDSRPEPTRRLPAQARLLWRLEAATRWGGAAIVALLVTMTAGEDLPGWARTALWAVPLAGAVIGVGLVPGVRWRRWRYEIREEEIDLRRGTFTVVRTLVPMARVQHVDTRSGVLEQSLGVATVVFHTAAGTNAIPALLTDEATAVRDRIATLARTPDEL